MKKKTPRFLSIFLLFLLLYACDIDDYYGELIPAYTEYEKTAGKDYLEVMVYGDAGYGTDGQQLTADEMASYAADPDNSISFVINLGDSFYMDGVDSVTDPLWESDFESVYDPAVLSMPFYSILGNHDYKGNIQAQLDYVSANSDRWQMPGRYYGFSRTLPDGTAIDFFFLDTESLYYGDAEQLVWLEQELGESDADWVIVSGHKPLFSYGLHGFYSPLILRLQPLFNHKVDLYLAGHEHDLQILGPVEDVYYIVNGSAADVRNTSVGNLTQFAASKRGFMSLLISSEDLVCRVIESGSGVLYTKILKNQ